MTSDIISDPTVIAASPGDIPRLDWDRGPWNRWTFQHMREILPTVEVWRGNGQRSRLETNERNIDELPVKDSLGNDTTLAGLLDETFTDGFLVLKDGAIAYERYFNGMTHRTLHLSQSMAKSITGMVAGILVGRGLLDPAEPVTAYLPELEQTGWRGAKLQHVLDMTTGVKFSEEYTHRYSEIGQVDVASGWKPIPPDSDPGFEWSRDMWELVLRLKETTRPHGAAFEYRSIETDVLAFAMERVTGKRLADLVSEEIWQKIGADESANFTVDCSGYALADAGFSATLRDYGRFGQMILDYGAGIVPAAWVEATRTSTHSADFHPSLPQGAYKNQFWILDPHSRSLMCKGVFGQFIIIDFENTAVYVKLSSYPYFTSDAYSIATYKAIKTIAKAL